METANQTLKTHHDSKVRLWLQLKTVRLRAALHGSTTLVIRGHSLAVGRSPEMVPFQPLFFHGRPNGDFSPPPHRPLRDSVPTSFSLILFRLIITIRFCFRYVLYSCLALKHPCDLMWSALLETVINKQLFLTTLLFPSTVSDNGSLKPFP